MTNDFYRAIEGRRSIYGIDQEVNVSKEKIVEIIQHGLKHTPSAFNSQSGRVVLLLGEHHNRLWEITKEVLRGRVAADKFFTTEEKINSFKSGYGTILFFEDFGVIEGLQNRFKSYADHFPVWANQSNGMLQLVIWSALELEGLGASLQHYNPLIDEEVRQAWDLPTSWKLISQMPFGNPTAPAKEKEYKPLEERMMVFE